MKDIKTTVVIIELCLLFCLNLIQIGRITEVVEMTINIQNTIMSKTQIEENIEHCVTKHYQASNEIDHKEIKQTEYVIDITPTEKEILYYVVANEVGADYLSDASRQMVASVIINRVQNETFPDTVMGVVSAKGQFTEAYNNSHTKKVKPSESVIASVDYILEHGAIIDATYYYAPAGTKTTTGHWFENNLNYVCELDGQRYFKEYTKKEGNEK